jgi:hypothetical protein
VAYISLTFKIHEGLRFPHYEVRRDDASMPMYIQFYPAFKPNQTLDSLKKVKGTALLSDSTKFVKQKKTLKKK